MVKLLRIQTLISYSLVNSFAYSSARLNAILEPTKIISRYDELPYSAFLTIGYKSQQFYIWIYFAVGKLSLILLLKKHHQQFYHKKYFALKILPRSIGVSIADTCCIVDEQFPFYYILKRLTYNPFYFWHCIGIGVSVLPVCCGTNSVFGIR